MDNNYIVPVRFKNCGLYQEVFFGPIIPKKVPKTHLCYYFKKCKFDKKFVDINCQTFLFSI